MKIECAHDEVVDLDLLVPNPKNPNKHPDEQIKLLAKIMNHQGWRSPIVVSNRSGFITKGHGRMMAAKLNGWNQAPVDRQDYATEADEYADMVADNKIAELAETDMLMVNEGAMALGPDFDLELLGIPDFEIVPTEELEPGCNEDAVPEFVEPKSKLGDIYQLGRHRLMCGDSTSIDAVEKLMNGEKADMVFTDPPYNYTPTNRGSGALGAQASKVGKKIEFISSFEPKAFLSILSSIKSEPFAAYIFCNTELVRDYLNWAYEEDFNFNILTWHKTKFIPANSNHHFPDTEYCIFISKRPIFHSGLSADHYRKYWIENKDGNDLHPTMKPVKIIEQCIELNSNKSVIDFFGGSGSTMIAAEKLGRKCFMLELDPKYCDVIIARWEKYTGKKAELLNG
jgi:DNA modification methylase